MTTRSTAPTLPPALQGAIYKLPKSQGKVIVYGAGSGPPLLLIHSINAVASAAEVRPLFEQLAQNCSVYALDLPGYGLSAREDQPYTVRLMTDTILKTAAWVRTRHRAAPVHALAVSLSCEFLARAAAEQPALFKTLTLVSPTGFRSGQALEQAAGSTRYKAGLDRFLRGPGWGGFLFRQLTRPAVIRYFLERTWGAKQIDESLWAYNCISARQPNAECAPLAFLSGILFSTDIHRIYQSLEQPTLVLHGVRGDFTNYQMLSLVQDRPNWQVQVLQTGAMPYFEQPDAVMALVREFLARAGT